MSNEDVDYDKQFQADLERAQALSLETLALEKFRMQKQLKQLSLVSSDSTDSCSTPVEKGSYVFIEFLFNLMIKCFQIVTNPQDLKVSN